MSGASIRSAMRMPLSRSLIESFTLRSGSLMVQWPVQVAGSVNGDAAGDEERAVDGANHLKRGDLGRRPCQRIAAVGSGVRDQQTGLASVCRIFASSCGGMWYASAISLADWAACRTHRNSRPAPPGTSAPSGRNRLFLSDEACTRSRTTTPVLSSVRLRGWADAISFSVLPSRAAWLPTEWTRGE